MAKSTKPLLLQAQLDSPLLNGAALKEMRRKSEITQAELAEKAEVTQALVSQIEGGARMTEETGTALWNALVVLTSEKYVSSGKCAADAATMKPGLGGAWQMMERLGITPDQMTAARDNLIEAQRKQIELLGKQIESLEKMIDLDAVDTLAMEVKRQGEELKELKLLFAKRSEAIGTTADADDAEAKILGARLKKENS